MTSTLIDRLAGVSEGLAVKVACKAATTTNITLAGLQTIDAVVLIEGDRVLVKDQNSALQNGIYNASTGNWTRADDFDGSRDVVRGTRVSVVSGGTVNGTSEWEITSTDVPITFGVSNITFQTPGWTVVNQVAASAAAAAASAVLADSPIVTVISGTTHTLDASESGSILVFTSASAITVTCPKTQAVKFNVSIVQWGAGQITFSPVSGATISCEVTGATKTAAQFSPVALAVLFNTDGNSAQYLLTGRVA